MGLFLLSILYAIVSVSGFVLIRMSGGFDITINNAIFNVKFTSHMLFGLVLYVAGFLLYLFIIPRLTFNQTFPILNGAMYTLIVISGVVVFNERMSVQHFIGVALVLVGIIILGMARS